MKISLLIRCVLTLMVFSWNGGAKATNLLNLKDTVTVLPEQLSRLSLLHGAMAWHSGAIMNMYDYGVPAGEPLIPRVKNENETEEDFITRKQKANAAFKTWESSIESPIIKDVVRKLFYRIPGTTMSADFKVANKEQDAFNKNKQLYINKATEYLVALLNRAIIESYIKINVKDKKILNNYNTNLKNILFLPKSITEEDFFLGSSQDQIRVEIVIRLACLWALIGHDRILIKTYYQCLKSMLENMKKILKKPLKMIGLFNKGMLASWKGEGIVFGNEGFKNKKDAETHLLQPNTEPMVLLEALSCLSFVKELTPASYSNINYKDKEYANCSDTVVRNIINYIIFDKNGQFNISVIENILGEGHQVHESLRQFYKANSLPSKQDNKLVHEAWGDVVSNLEFVEYKKAINNNDLVNLETTKGFIKLPNGVDNQHFITEGFTVVDSTVECFEVRSTAHNLIIILNHILQLNLFNHSSLAQDYFNENFVETYLPKVFEKIGKIEYTENNENNFSFSLNLNDTLMNNLGHSYSKLDINFQIRRHGTFDITKIDQNINMDNIIKQLKQNASNFLLSNSLLFVLPVNKWFNAFPNINESLALPLWSNFKEVDAVSKILNQHALYKRRINMHEYNLLKKIINLHADQKIKNKYLNDLESLWNLIKDFQTIQDEEKIKQFVQNTLKSINNSIMKGEGYNWIYLYNFLFSIENISKYEIFTNALNIVIDVINIDSTNRIKRQGNILLKETLTLVSTQHQDIRNEIYTNALDITINAINANNYEGFALLQTLVEHFSSQDQDDMQVQIFEQALDITINKIKTNDYQSFKLLQTLIQYSSPQNQEIRNKIYTNALNIAINKIKTNDYQSFSLLKTLVKHVSSQDQDDMQIQIFEQILNAMQNLVRINENYTIELFIIIIYRFSNDQLNENKLKENIKEQVFNKALIMANNFIIEKSCITFDFFKILLEHFNNPQIIIDQIIGCWIYIANNIREYLISNDIYFKSKVFKFFEYSFSKIFSVSSDLDQNKKKEITLHVRDVINKIEKSFTNRELLILKEILNNYEIRLA